MKTDVTPILDALAASFRFGYHEGVFHGYQLGFWLGCAVTALALEMVPRAWRWWKNRRKIASDKARLKKAWSTWNEFEKTLPPESIK